MNKATSEQSQGLENQSAENFNAQGAFRALQQVKGALEIAQAELSQYRSIYNRAGGRGAFANWKCADAMAKQTQIQYDDAFIFYHTDGKCTTMAEWRRNH